MIKPTTVEVSIYLSVTSPADLFQAAKERAQRDGLFADDAGLDDTLGTAEAPDLANCVRLFLDPGLSPPGCTILDTTAEVG